MKTTRRGLFAWLSALTGAAAVSRVAPAEVRPVFTHVATNPKWVPPSKRFAHHFAKPAPEPLKLLRTPEDVVEMLSAGPYTPYPDYQAISGASSVARGTHDVYPRIGADGKVEHVKVKQS